MSKVSHLPKRVPPKEIPFKLKIKGSVNKDHTYEGDFVVKVPMTREVGQIGIELAKLSDGIPLHMLDKSTATLNNAVAYLRVSLVEAPKWFTNSPDDEDEEGISYGLDTLDFNIPIEVFRAADKAVKAWYKALRQQPEEPINEAK